MSTVAQKEPKRLKLSEMTKQEARIAIASDVIGQIRRERYIAHPGKFTDVLEYADVDGNVLTNQQAADAVRAGRAQCEVCAVGAGVVSAAGLFNKLPDGDEECEGPIVLSMADDNYGYLGKFFPKTTLALMECAFEREPWSQDRGVKVSATAESAAVAFGTRWIDDGERLEAVWLNVLANDGAFDPSWLPSRRTKIGRAMGEPRDMGGYGDDDESE